MILLVSFVNGLADYKYVSSAMPFNKHHSSLVEFFYFFAWSYQDGLRPSSVSVIASATDAISFLSALHSFFATVLLLSFCFELSVTGKLTLAPYFFRRLSGG